MAASARTFVWYELMTSDLQAARRFYSRVIGWSSQDWEHAITDYALMSAGPTPVAGVMPMPDDYIAAGGKPVWLGYIGVDDVDAAAEAVRGAGGAVHRPGRDIPQVGRFAVVADPQGAMFMLFKPEGGNASPPPPMTPGHVGWHELYTTDWKAALGFYAAQFGWTKSDALDMPGMGTYQLFAAGDQAIGGMMNKPNDLPIPMWLFYFNVEAIDAALKRVAEAGGQVLLEPQEVPGGSWIVHAFDPQGAHFALVAPKR